MRPKTTDVLDLLRNDPAFPFKPDHFRKLHRQFTSDVSPKQFFHMSMRLSIRETSEVATILTIRAMIGTPIAVCNLSAVICSVKTVAVDESLVRIHIDGILRYLR